MPSLRSRNANESRPRRNQPRRRCLLFECLEDRRVMTTELISSASDGTQGNRMSDRSSISADGRYIAFASYASNLVAGDTNLRHDIFLKDTVSGITTLISSASDGTSANNDSYDFSISADGRYVAFQSYASNLVAGDRSILDGIFLKDTVSGKTTLVSSDSKGTRAFSGSHAPAISADHRYVTFASDAWNLVPGDVNNSRDIFKKDLFSGATTLVSSTPNGSQGNSDSDTPTISADGRYIAFRSQATNLVPNEVGVFVKDTESGSIKLASIAKDGTQGFTDSRYPSITSDGHYVVFVGDVSGIPNVFRKDILNGDLVCLSTALDGEQGNSSSYSRNISADGRYLAFASDATNLVVGDSNNTRDIFVKDTLTGAIKIVNLAFNGLQSNGGSLQPAISDDGRYVVFESDATNLVRGDRNNKQDIFRVTNPLFNPSLSARLTNGDLIIDDLQGKRNVISLYEFGTDVIIQDAQEVFQVAPAGGRLVNDNVVTIPAALITGSIVINTGGGDDLVTVSAYERTTPFTKSGKIAVNLGAGTDTLSLNASSSPSVWNIAGPQSGLINQANGNKISFQGMERGVGSPAADRFLLTNTGTNGILSLNSDKRNGIDSLEIIRDTDLTLSNSKLEVGGNFPQTFALSGFQKAALTGGPGNNFLNASVFTGPVHLNGGDGNDILWGGSGNDILNGGSGNDWLSGNAGDDTLLGYNGRDILVGGIGSDKLNNNLKWADTGDDILIGGKTNFDTNKAAIDALLAAWASPLTYLDHIKQLSITGVGPAKQYKLNATTVFDDNTIDILIGGTGNDWFFAGTSGTKKDTHDRSGFEQVVGL